MITVSFRTKNCIVTGKPATMWTGHVIYSGYGPIRSSDKQLVLQKCSVTSGFATRDDMSKVASDDCGCHGHWKPADGIEAEVYASTGMQIHPVSIREGEH